MREGGTLRPSILAVSALMTSSNLFDCTTGRSAGLVPLSSGPGVDAGLAPRLGVARSVADQAANFDKSALRIDRRERMARRQLRQLNAPGGEERPRSDEQGLRPLAREAYEGRIDLAARAGFKNLRLQAHVASRRVHVPQCRLGNRLNRIDEHGDTQPSRAPARAAAPAAWRPARR